MRRSLVALFVLCLFLVLPVEKKLHGAPSGEQPVFRIGFTRSTIGAVNENDAMAAVQIWAENFVREQDIKGDPRPIIYDSSRDLREALENQEVECIDITMDQYQDIEELIAKEYMVGGVTSGSVFVEYVVLARVQNKIDDLSMLSGRHLSVVDSAIHSLSLVWLDALLGQMGRGLSETFFRRITRVGDVSDAVLPVFFGQVDCCVVTRKAFTLLAELNPQIAERLMVVASSPPVVPMIFGFRKDFESPVIEKVMREATNWHLSPAGRQILTMFKTDSLKRLPFDQLDTTLELLHQQRRLRGMAVKNN